VDVNLVLSEERMVEGNVDASVGIFDIEDYGVASDFTPVLDDADAAVAGGHDSGEIDGADFEIFGDRDGLLGDGGGQDAGDDDVFVALQYVARVRLMICGADGVSQFGGRQVAGLAEVMASDGGDRFSALGSVYFGAGRGEGFRRWNGELGRSGGCACAQQLGWRLR